MSTASTFRSSGDTATTVETTLNSGVSDDNSATSPSSSAGELLYTYEDEVRMPYVANYLGIKDIWDKEPSLENEVKELESYLRQMVVSKKLDNNTNAAQKYLERMEKDAGIEPYENANRRIEKLRKYIEFRKVVDS